MIGIDGLWYIGCMNISSPPSNKYVWLKTLREISWSQESDFNSDCMGEIVKYECELGHLFVSDSTQELICQKDDVEYRVLY